MSIPTIRSSCPTGKTQDLIDFFEKSSKPPETAKKTINSIPEIAQRISYCASWVNDQSFETGPDEEPSKHTEFTASPLPESVYSCLGFQVSMEKKRKISEKLETKEPEKRRKSEPPSKTSSSFFKKLAQATSEIENSFENPAKWKKYNGIFIENHEEETEEPSTSSSPKTEYEELMSLFRKGLEVYESMNFEFAYKFDWNHFSKHSTQFIIFTKVCQSHPVGHFMEMTKEDTKCRDCGGSDLALTVRLTIPLDLSEIPIPCYEDLQIHVAFLADQLLEIQNLKNKNDFSRETCERMYDLYRRLMNGKPSQRYTEWFERCHRFAKNSLYSKRLQLHHGHVARRKFEETQHSSKRRSLIFAHIFDLE